MTWHKAMLAGGLTIRLASFVLFSTSAHAQSIASAAGVEGGKNIRTLKEIRGEGGAAALGYELWRGCTEHPADLRLQVQYAGDSDCGVDSASSGCRSGAGPWRLFAA
jgi:hypothetical protein